MENIVETVTNESKTVELTADQLETLQAILNRTLQVELSEAGRSPKPREAVQRVNKVIELIELLEG